MEFSDLDYIKQANDGDQEALEALYHRHRQWVYSQAYRYCQNNQDAMDITQDTFSYFFNKFPGFQLHCQLRTFLYPVIRNKSLNLLKKYRRESTSLESIEESSYLPKHDSQLIENFRERISGLSEEHRDVIILRFMQDMSLDEIAATLNIPNGTVKSRLHNALKELRQ